MSFYRSRLWIVPALGAVAIAVPAAYVLLVVPMQERDSNDAVQLGSPEFQRLRKAYVTGDLTEMQSVMAGQDIEAAKLAATRLTERGFEATKLMFEQLGRSSPEVQLAVQQTPFPEVAAEVAAKLLESGTDAEKASALVFLDAKPDPIHKVVTAGGTAMTVLAARPMSAAVRYRILLALVPFILDASEDDADRLADLASRHSWFNDQPLVDLLSNESPIVRRIAVRALQNGVDEGVLARVRVLRSDPDPKVRTAARDAVKSIQANIAAMKKRLAEQKAFGLDPGSQAKKKAEKTLGMP